MASYPKRCQHIKGNGTQCGSPPFAATASASFTSASRTSTSNSALTAPAIFLLPVLGDATSIQAALLQVMRLLFSQQMDHKTASLLLYLYALQTASSNLRQTNFKPFRHDVVLDPRDVANTPLDSHVWKDEDFEDEKTEAKESPADRAIRKLEEDRKKKGEDAK